jgi:4-amino-4-deoxy-L-arabinose transferase
MNTNNRPAAWLVLLFVVLAFTFQGTRAVWEPDEGRYSSAGLNMLNSGDYVIPSIDGEHPDLAKPPATYWALAAGFAVFGKNEWAARMPGALAFIGTGLLVFGLGRQFCPARPWLPALIYGLSLAPFMGANVVSNDVLLVFFETAAMYAFVRAWASDGSVDRRWFRIMWLAWGLAFMTKGPPGLLPLLAMITMLVLGDRAALRRMFDPAGLVAFAVVAFTWFGVVVAEDPSRLGHFLGHEAYDRVFASARDRNARWYGALLVYGPVFLFGALPWWPLALTAAGGPRRAWSAFCSRLAARDRDWVVLAWWFLLPLAVFCLARSRVQLYVTPLFVPLALMLARPLAKWDWLRARRLATIAVLTAAILLTLKGVAGHVHVSRDARDMAAAIRRIVDPRSIDGIVFVGMRPFYGLRLYLDVPIEGVQIAEHRDHDSKYVAEEDLCSELETRQKNVYAMKENRAAGFDAAVQRCDQLTAERIGQFQADENMIALFAVW